MTTKELIAKLKDRKRAQQWFLQTDEERNILRTAGPQNCLYTSCEVYPEWRTPLGFGQGKTYILKPDYELKPESSYELDPDCVDIEITDLVELIKSIKLIDIPDVTIQLICENKRVFARFRKE